MMPKGNFATFLKLAVISLIVGTTLAFMDIRPLEIWREVYDWFAGIGEFIFGRGLQGLLTALKYTLYGAVVVVPVWLFITIFQRKSSSKESSKD